MVIKGMISYPVDSKQEYYRRAKRSCAFPHFMNVKGPFISLGQKGIVQQLVYYEFEESKTLDAFRAIFNHFDEFLDIPGITFRQKY